MSVNQLKAGAILNYVVLFLNNILGLLYMPYLLRMLGQNEYGLYSLVASVIAYLTVLDLGFGNAIIRYTAKFKAECKLNEQYEMFGMFVVLYVVIGFVSFLLGLVLYFNVGTLFGDTMSQLELERARIMMLMMVINVAVTFPFSVFGAIITAYENFVFQKVVNIIRIVLNTIVMIALLEMGYKAVAMVVLQTVFNIGTLLLNYFYCIHKLKIKILFAKFDWSFLKEVSVYSFWILLNVIMDRIYWSTGQLVLGAVVGTAAVAVFAVAIQLEHMYMSFSSAISNVFLPRITTMVATQKTNKEISDLFVRTGRIQYIVLAYILCGFVVFGKSFIIIWAGPDYEEAYVISLLFFIPLTIPLIQNLGISILQARNQMKFRSLLYVGIALLSLFFQITLSRKYGGIGCAMAISGALIIGQIFIMNIYYHKVQRLDMILFWKEILKMSVMPVVLSVLSYITLSYFKIDTVWSLMIGVTAFTLIYIPLFWLTSMNNYEKKLILTTIH